MRNDTLSFPNGIVQEGVVIAKTFDFIRESRTKYDTLKTKSSRSTHKKETGVFGILLP